jgi:tetratricopeptide (TPR) repeat protein
MCSNLKIQALWPWMLLLTVFSVGCGGSPDSPEVKLERARILMEREQAAEAIPLLNEVVDVTPKDPEARYQRGVAYENLNVLEKALNDYNECLILDSERTDALNNKAVVLAKMERFKEAAVEFTRLVDLDPQGALAYRNRGLCHVDLEDYETALADYAKALELDPKDSANWYQRAGVYLAQKRYEEAEQDYTKAIEITPDLAPAWMNRGVARYKRGEKKLAAEDLKKAQSLDENIVVPDIGFFDDAQAAPENLPTTESRALDWSAVKLAAEKEMSAKGFSGLLLMEETPELLCGQYQADLNGRSWTVLVAVVTAAKESVVLPAEGVAQASQSDPALNATALMILEPSGSEQELAVRSFEKPWSPVKSSAGSTVVPYKLP